MFYTEQPIVIAKIYPTDVQDMIFAHHSIVGAPDTQARDGFLPKNDSCYSVGCVVDDSVEPD